MYRKYIKRFLDIVFSIILIVIFSFPILVLGLIVYISDWNNPFFVQTRYGLNSESFDIIKIRTMKVNTPEIANGDFKDMRLYLTPIGRFLRRTSLDELPQLINVLMGEMSFVGPRPLAFTDQEVVDLRKSSGADQVRPGITGLAQINGRNHISNSMKANYDYQYFTKVSVWLDLYILTKTVCDVFKQSGVNLHQTGK